MSDTVKAYVIAILALQAVSVACLWILNVLSAETSSVFSVLLAANLVAFAIVIQVYRNPSTVEPNSAKKKPAGMPVAAPTPAPSPGTASGTTPASTPVTSTIPAQAAPEIHATHSKSTMSPSPVMAALPGSIHVAIPIASAIVILAFAIVTFLPSNKSTLPVESTVYFIPIYLTIVVVLVLGSMYLFKRLMDTEEDTYDAAHTH
jgi:flagellar biosynthesis protein FliQ